ncbi:MAG TPA: CapA family protein [Patescibacteria group bacterium]|nr:CapA family protein [Patescibacteria group bacterium]
MKKLVIMLVLIISTVFYSSALAVVPMADNLKLTFVGDILLARHPGYIMRDTGNINYPFQFVTDELSKADITFGNMEGAFTGNVVTGNVSSGKGRWFCFRSPASFAPALKNAGFDIVTLANNHSMNGGKQGIVDTVNTLDKLKIRHVGAGVNKAQANKCEIIDYKGWKVGFLGRASIGTEGGAGVNSPGIGVLNKEIFDAVKDCQTKAEIVVATFHWGNENQTVPTAIQKDYAHRLIDAGVDIVIGHHPHVLQPIEIYKGKTIAYSLGNFVFDNPKKSWKTTMILTIEIDCEYNQHVTKIPVEIQKFQPRIMDKPVVVLK